MVEVFHPRRRKKESHAICLAWFCCPSISVRLKCFIFMVWKVASIKVGNVQSIFILSRLFGVSSWEFTTWYGAVNDEFFSVQLFSDVVFLLGSVVMKGFLTLF